METLLSVKVDKFACDRMERKASNKNNISTNVIAAVPENGMAESGRARKCVGQDTEQGRPGQSRVGQWRMQSSGTMHRKVQGGARVSTDRSQNQSPGGAWANHTHIGVNTSEGLGRSRV